MGNVQPQACFRRKGKGKVKVILLSGEVKEFSGFATSTSTVMKKYPHHLVLHCSTVTAHHVAQRRKLTVLKPEQLLKPNQTYLLIPIQSAGAARTFLDSWTFFSLNSSNSKASEEELGAKGQSRKKWWHAQIFNSMFKPKMPRTSTDEANPFLNGPSQSAYRSRKSAAESDIEWRPSLECIPESPMRSPLLHQKSASNLGPSLVS